MKPFRILAVLCIVSLFGFSAASPADEILVNGPTSGWIRPDRLNRLEAPAARIAGPVERPQISTRGELENYIQGQMAQKHIAGLSSSIFKEGEVIWTGTFGHADFDAPAKPVEPGTLFMLASVTKAITATALMHLWEQGLFDLHDPINSHLPFAVIHPFFPDRGITFHMLLTHTSGIKDNWSVMPYYPGDSPIPLGEYLEDYLVEGGAYYYQYANFYEAEPGTQYRYSNIAVALIGYLVESISGMPLEPYCRQNLFKPLGMDETSYFLANLDLEHIAKPYYWNGSSYTSYGHFGYSDYPSGQIRTSAPQLMTFLSTFMQNRLPADPFQGPNASGELSMGTGRMQASGSVGGSIPSSGAPPMTLPRILEPATVQTMLTSQIPGIKPSQGLIWYKKWIGGYLHWGHNGGDQGVTTEMMYCPDLEIGLVVLTNGESGFNNIFEAMFDYANAY